MQSNVVVLLHQKEAQMQYFVANNYVAGIILQTILSNLVDIAQVKETEVLLEYRTVYKCHLRNFEEPSPTTGGP